MCMGADFKQEGYGLQAKIVKQTDDCMIVDYGNEGRAMITNYFLFDGSNFALWTWIHRK